MPILSNFWNKIIEWFSDYHSRNQMVRSFNASAREAYVHGVVPVMMEAKIVKGEPAYHHQFSNWAGSGFRIKTFAGRQLSRKEIINIGETILANDMLVKRLVVLGWDTLQIHSDVGNHGCQWQLHDYIMIGGPQSDT